MTTSSDFLARYDALTATGLAANPEPVGRKRDTIEAAGYNLAASLTKLRPEATRFINDLSVPSTNNEGERSIRMAKLEDKRVLPERGRRQGIRHCPFVSRHGPQARRRRARSPRHVVPRRGVDAIDNDLSHRGRRTTPQSAPSTSSHRVELRPHCQPAGITSVRRQTCTPASVGAKNPRSVGGMNVCLNRESFHQSERQNGHQGSTMGVVKKTRSAPRDLTVVAVPVYFGGMAAEYLWLHRQAARRGPTAGDYELHDTLTSLAMSVGSLVAPLVVPKLLRPFTPGRGRYGKTVVAVALGAAALTTVADMVADRAGDHGGRGGPD